jgi:probable rRNA maturation factor
MVRIDIYTEGRVSLPFERLSETRIKGIVRAGCAACNIKNSSVTIILCDDEIMRNVNRTYRGKDYTTDVLSFAYLEEPIPVPKRKFHCIGDIYISLTKAKEQAAEYKVEFENEVIRLIVHAFCHLIGYDHERSKMDAEKMHKKEDEVITKVCRVMRVHEL